MRHLRFWRWRQAEDDDIDRELATHLDIAAEERADAGVPAKDAELAARREFGSVALTKERLRALRPGSTIARLVSNAVRDFFHGLRLLRKEPAFTAVAVITLALPIAANAVMFTLVNALVLQSRPGRIDSLVSVFSRDRQRPDSYRDFSYPLYVDLRDRSGVFSDLMAHTVALVGIREGDTTRRSFVEVVSSNYFSTIGVQLAAGRAFSPVEERPGSNALVTIASYSAWQQHGLRPDFIGSRVRVNGSLFTIVGIAPKGMRTTPLVSPDWWFPLGTYDKVINEWFRDGPRGLDDRANHTLFLAGSLEPGLTRAAADAKLDALALQLAEQFPGTDRDRAFATAPVPMNLGSSPRNDTPLTFVAGLLLLMAALVLGIACLNLANLMVARGAARRKEIAIRQALGGSRFRIVGQLFMEGLSVSLIGAAAGLILSWWADAALNAWLGSAVRFVAIDGIDVAIEPSRRMAAVAGGLALFSTFCFALGPAWRLSRPAVTSDLKDLPGVVERRFGSGSVLVAIQLTVSLALLAVSGLFVRSAIEAASASPGFALERELVFSIDPSLGAYDEAHTRALYRDALQRVRVLPGVDHVSLASKVAFGEFEEGGFVGVPDIRARDVTAGFTIVTSDYFATLRLPVLRGRGFTHEEDTRPGGIAAAIVSEPLARRLFADADPLGRQVTLRKGSAETGGRGNAETKETLTIVGVVPGTTQDIFDAEPRLQIYVPYGSRFRAAMVLHVAISPLADESAMLKNVQQELRRLDSQLPILTARTMNAQRDASVPRWAVRAAAVMFGIFGTLALLIASTGVYGLESYDVARRTRELGIRMALGATTTDVQRLVLRKGLTTAVVGLSLGMLLAAGVGRLVSSILYRVSPLDPAALIAAVIVLAAATMLACYVPARRATRIETLEALRTE
ncbi:MAG TPA: ADOP family duplicated permease [Vicinamibacterales bacterium]|jgi:predicted permease